MRINFAQAARLPASRATFYRTCTPPGRNHAFFTASPFTLLKVVGGLDAAALVSENAGAKRERLLLAAEYLLFRLTLALAGSPAAQTVARANAGWQGLLTFLRQHSFFTYLSRLFSQRPWPPTTTFFSCRCLRHHIFW